MATKRKAPSDRRVSRKSARKRLALRADTVPDLKCTTPGCGKPVSAVGGRGFSMTLCRTCLQRLNRTGSAWSKRLSAEDLRPFITAAEQVIAANLGDPDIKAAISGFSHLLAFSPRVLPVDYLRWESPEGKARQVFSRLALKDTQPRKLLVAYLAVAACLYGHPKYPQTERFRLAAISKVMMRQAGGVVRTYEVWDPKTGEKTARTVRKFPRSGGLVLLKLGEMLDREAAGALKWRDAVSARARLGSDT